MADFLHSSAQRDSATPDTAVIRIDQLHALAGLLSLEAKLLAPSSTARTHATVRIPVPFNLMIIR
ncbi:hypothetical protein OKW49_002578 [Paraburkholderia youngii]|uniref:hypothetical protein n=1 Tax=Paraburkholderia youngii TaxID=2782701 RepID=UPI003D1C69EB